MLTKFETHSNRVKGISFHPKRPWIICGLHNGHIQLWDYRLSTPIDRYEEHEGPVRGVDFHSSQPLFVSGGDDYKIKVFNYKLRRCMTTFSGHLDYIRMVQFHREQPWIVSASDDQTIRIWNWQSRNSVSVLTGHNHYVMSAQFHPREDLIVSASLDLTIRVWDISGLRAKKQDSSLALPQDLFGSNDVVVKFILEGHEKGVNWAAFHQTKPYIVSGADDRSIRIWKMDDARTYEVEQLRGHTNNVSCVAYFKDMIVSVSEDRSIRVWDASMRSALQTQRRENDRFWVLAVHPEQNLLAAGHDSGLLVFKLERERPAFCIHSKVLYWVKERTLRTYDFETKSETAPLTIRRHNYPPLTLSCNPADSMAVLWYDYDGGVFELFTIPRPGHGTDGDVKKGFYTSAVFFSANKFAVLDKTRQIIIRTTTNDITKVLPAVNDCDRLFPGPQGYLICRSEEKVYLFQVAQRSIVAECAASKAKYVVWDSDFSKVAIQAKNQIVVATRKLKVLTTIHETARIKSCCFDEDHDVLLYTTTNHLKYASVRSTENGTLKTLSSPVYLVRAKGEKIWWISREGKVEQQIVDNTELNFKVALQQERYRDVIKMVRSKHLKGKALVAYLHKHGFSEIALHFVSDPLTRFSLAIDCGIMEIAKATAVELNSPECWKKLSETAVKYGDLQLAMFANAKLQDFNALGLQCVLTGNVPALSQVLAKASDENVVMHYSMFTEDAEKRIAILENAKQYPLAYALARSNGLDEIAEELLQKMDPEVASRCQRMNLPLAEPRQPVEPVTENWPLLPLPETLVSRLLRDPGSLDYVEDAHEALAGKKGGWGDELDDELEMDDEGKPDDAEEPGADAVPSPGTWDDDLEGLEINLPTTDVPVRGFVVPREGESVHRHWIDTSLLPAHHVAAGSFQSAIQLLQRQVGLVNPQPLKPLFLNIWASVNGVLPTFSTVPSHLYAATSPPSAAEFRAKHQPRLPRMLPVLTERVKQGYQLTTDGRFTDALRLFQGVLLQVLLCVVESKNEVNELRDILGVAREYIMALNVELARKEAPNPSMAVELAAYFTHFKLQNTHLILGLSQAMSQAFKAKNLKTAALLARQLLDLDPPQDRADKARKVIQFAESNPTDAHKIDYDDRNPFTLCTVSKRPMYRGTVDPIRCSFCYAPAHPKYKGQRCCVCLIAQLGADASGMINSVAQLVK